MMGSENKNVTKITAIFHCRSRTRCRCRSEILTSLLIIMFIKPVRPEHAECDILCDLASDAAKRN